MFQHFTGFVYLFAVSQLVSLAGAQSECPLQLDPQRVVVRYGGSVAANCSTSVLHKGMGWEASEGVVPVTKDQNLITWRVSELTEWDIKPVCYINLIHSAQCKVDLPVTVYKTPDSVFISTVNHRGPMTEGQQYELQCDVHNVAPVQYLTVKWYKGQTLLHQTTFTDTIKTPENKTVTLLIRPDRADDGAEYWCAAELDLGAEGPQPHPTISAKPLSIAVHGAQSECPLQLDPQRVVVRYGGSVAANCSTSVLHKGMGWEVSEGAVPMTKDQNLITWRVSELTEWDIKPFCFINYKIDYFVQCIVELPVKVYKTPDSVFISTVNHRGPMTEGQQYELQCDVHNVAPVQYLTVKWYKGQTLLHQTTFTDTIKTPENKTVTLLIRPDRADDGAEYWCAAELDLGAEGPQPHPTYSAKPLSIAVHGAQSECPLQLDPQRVVVRYAGSVAANCSTSVLHIGMGWEVSEGAVPMTKDQNLITWRVSELTEWDIKPFCFINYKIDYFVQCIVELPVKVYKTPDSVFISTVNHRGPMTEGQQYELQCDVHNVAPVQYLTVKWYKGQTLLHHTTFNDTIETPENKTVTLLIRPDRADDGAEYWCAAELDLGADGPQPHPTYSAKPLSIAVHGAQSECPLQLDPQRVVVRYGGSVAVNCYTSVLHKGMGWEASEGAVPMTRNQNLITWRVSELTEWDIKPVCYINPNDRGQCIVHLPVTVYKTPDSVFISTVNHRGPMMEGQQYELQCDVHNVAPVQYLTVKWYKGQTLLHQTTFTDNIKTPENKTVTLLIRPDRADDEAEYWCEAELDLGAEGPQPHPTISAKPLNVEVYYKPKHSNSTETIIQDDKDMLDCTVKVNPAPTYTWDHLKEKISSSVLKSSELSPGRYTCTATNTLGRDSKVFIVKSTGGF
uniref:Ig-like domain-containing protein n=1 Tax=Cyprinus carpio carpio TaxID=630221 RepID=A0A8C0YWC8_CYPCA